MTLGTCRGINEHLEFPSVNNRNHIFRRFRCAALLAFMSLVDFGGCAHQPVYPGVASGLGTPAGIIDAEEVGMVKCRFQ
jgi:hypothetical protein